MNQPFWDQMYQVDHYRYGQAPNAFLRERAALLPPGAQVLCAGDGEGRNGVWMATEGFCVTSLEPSAVGVAKIRALAQDRGVSPTLLQAALPTDLLPEAAFDAVAAIYLHLPPAIRPQAHAQLARALRPGGAIILEAFNPSQLLENRESGGPRDLAMLYSAAMMREDFAGLEIELLEACQVTLDEGPGHSGLAEVLRLVARRPR